TRRRRRNEANWPDHFVGTEGTRRPCQKLSGSMSGSPKRSLRPSHEATIRSDSDCPRSASWRTHSLFLERLSEKPRSHWSSMAWSKHASARVFTSQIHRLLAALSAFAV